jgi:hypothetical protein
VDSGAPTAVEIRELESDGQLLRFKQPQLVEVDSEPGVCGLWMPALELGASAVGETEAWEMLAELVITVFKDYRDHPQLKLHTSGVRQREAVLSAVSALYILQPA